jgi:hypothetical protein
VTVTLAAAPTRCAPARATTTWRLQCHQSQLGAHSDARRHALRPWINRRRTLPDCTEALPKRARGSPTQRHPNLRIATALRLLGAAATLTKRRASRWCTRWRVHTGHSESTHVLTQGCCHPGYEHPYLLSQGHGRKVVLTHSAAGGARARTYSLTQGRSRTRMGRTHSLDGGHGRGHAVLTYLTA